MSDTSKKCTYHEDGSCTPGELCSSECCPAHCAEGCEGRCSRGASRMADYADYLKKRYREEGH